MIFVGLHCPRGGWRSKRSGGGTGPPARSRGTGPVRIWGTIFPWS